SKSETQIQHENCKDLTFPVVSDCYN
ncbi:hypothetical protein pipiens_020454, partial [Culex pipiens pipiens]